MYLLCLVVKVFFTEKKKGQSFSLSYSSGFFFLDFPCQETPQKLGKKMYHETNHMGGEC